VQVVVQMLWLEPVPAMVCLMLLVQDFVLLQPVSLVCDQRQQYLIQLPWPREIGLHLAV
jgi:hypothetical protein